MRNLLLFLVTALVLGSAAQAQTPPDGPGNGVVTMVDLGATYCIPCKMMIPVLEAVEKDYAGRARITFIDIGRNPEAAKKYGLRVIPTQIFFDRQGNEAFRHEGFFDKDAISAVLDKLLRP